jgi:hypothetical protein
VGCVIIESEEAPSPADIESELLYLYGVFQEKYETIQSEVSEAAVHVLFCFFFFSLSSPGATASCVFVSSQIATTSQRSAAVERDVQQLEAALGALSSELDFQDGARPRSAGSFLRLRSQFTAATAAAAAAHTPSSGGGSTSGGRRTAMDSLSQPLLSS